MRPLPSARGSPSPQSQLPSEPCSSRELSAVAPAQPRGMSMQPGCPQGRPRVPPSLVEGRWEEEEGKRGPTRPTVSSSAARRAPSPRLRRLGLPSRPAPVLPAPCSRESGSFRPPPASRAAHRQAAEPRRPIGPTTGGERVTSSPPSRVWAFSLPRESAPARDLRWWPYEAASWSVDALGQAVAM